MLFYYNGYKRNGEKIEGTITAATSLAALATLQAKGIEIKNITGNTAEENQESSLFGKKPGWYDYYLFFRQFAVYKSCGYTISNALSNLAEGQENVRLKTAILQLRKYVVDEAMPIHEAFRKVGCFPSICAALIEAGEASGHSEEALHQIADYLRRHGQISQKVNEATIIPKITIGFLGIAAAVMIFLTLPRYEKLYASLRIELPWITQVIMKSMRLLFDNSILASAIATGIISWWLWIEKKNRILYETILDNIPIYKSVRKCMQMYNFATTMYLLKSGAIPPSQAIKLAAATMDSVRAEVVLETAVQQIQEGSNIYEAIAEADKKTNIFSKIMLNFLHTGEETGETQRLLQEASDFYRDLLDAEVAMFPRKLIPAVAVPVAIATTILMLAIYMPTFTMMNAVK